MKSRKIINHSRSALTALTAFMAFTIIWLVTGSIAVFLRLHPLFHHTSNDSNEKASMLIINNLRKTIKETVEDKYPQMPANKKYEFIQKKFDELLHDNRKDIRKSIFELSRKLDAENQKENLYPYLLASDSFYYYGQTEDIIQNGNISDEIKGSKYLNKRMLAPLGHWEPLNLHPFVGVFTHKLLSSLKPDMSLMSSVSFTPLLLVILTLIPFYIISHHFKIGPWPSLVGSIYLICAPIFLKRSMFGWYDNDPYNLFFGFLILTFLFKGLRHLHARTKMIIYAVLTALAIPLYALFWQGWVFLESVLFISGCGIIFFNHFIIKNKNDSKKLALFFATALSLSFLGISLIFGIKEFFILFQEGWVALMGFTKNDISLWPDLYIAVGELRKADFFYIMEKTGGPVFITFVLLGIISSIKDLFKKSFSDDQKFCLITLGVFIIFATVMGLGARRFVLLFLVPASLFSLIGFYKMYQYIKNLLVTLAKKNIYRLTAFAIIGFIAIFSLIVFPLKNAYTTTPSLLNQLYNDTWNNALVEINNDTPVDSIINSWWPPGHFITSIAKRRVTFDGATINKPQAYWMANVFLSQNEGTALGLLRMLNNSANGATDYLLDQGFKLSETVDILKNIAPLSREKAANLLADKITPQQTEHLLTMTHNEPPPSYLLIYNDLVDKNIQLPFVGYWNIKRMEEFNEDAKLKGLVPKPGTKPYIEFLWTIAGGRPRYSGLLKVVEAAPEVLTFYNNIEVNMITKDCLINSEKYGRGKPLSLFYIEGHKLVEKKFPNANLRYSVYLIEKKGRYHVALLDTKLAHSLLMQLFFYNGTGMKHFHHFFHDINFTGRTEIKIFEIDWNGLGRK